jgi:hypothetical protein
MMIEVNMELHWTQLLTLKVGHAYYADGSCRDFSFQPTEETELNLKNLRLIFRQTPDGFVLLADSKKSLGLVKSPLLKVEKLSFLIRNANAKFYNFTDLTFPAAGSLFYFHNRLENVAGKLKRKMLHGKDFFTAAEEEQVRWSGRRFNYDLGAKKPGKWELADALGRKMPAEAALIPDGSSKLLIDLRDKQEGAFTLKAGDKPFQFYTSDKMLDAYFGVLDIYLDQASGKYQLVGKDQFVSQEYHIQFQNRKTYWRYFLIDQGAKKEKPNFSDPVINTNGTELPFGKFTFVELPNQHHAAVVESTEPLALHERVSDNDKLLLRMKRDGKAIVKPIKLPKPAGDIIKPDKESGKIYSEIYCYI